jgi:pentatricopeptide repeat protein
MSVCVKCNECDLALDVFQQLLAEGCSPNLVTFNILIDIHGKQGAWAKAVEVLDQLHAQGLTAEPRTYNTIISACSKAGQPAAAARVYERMLVRLGFWLPAAHMPCRPVMHGHDHAPPCSSCTALPACSAVSTPAHGFRSAPPSPSHFLICLQADGVQPTGTTYTSLISAFGKAGQVEEALRVYQVRNA